MGCKENAQIYLFTSLEFYCPLDISTWEAAQSLFQKAPSFPLKIFLREDSTVVLQIKPPPGCPHPHFLRSNLGSNSSTFYPASC